MTSSYFASFGEGSHGLRTRFFSSVTASNAVLLGMEPQILKVFMEPKQHRLHVANPRHRFNMLNWICGDSEPRSAFVLDWKDGSPLSRNCATTMVLLVNTVTSVVTGRTHAGIHKHIPTITVLPSASWCPMIGKHLHSVPPPPKGAINHGEIWEMTRSVGMLLCRISQVTTRNHHKPQVYTDKIMIKKMVYI